MTIRKLTDNVSVAAQISAADVPTIAADGFKSIICNRPDGESADQPPFAEIERAALEAGLAIRYIPVNPSKMTDADADKFGDALDELPKPTLAYCRSGARSTALWTMSQARKPSTPKSLGAAAVAGSTVGGATGRVASGGSTNTSAPAASHDIVIVGGGAAGASTAASLLRRDPALDIAVIDPAETHYYQPGWTMVGGGVFRPESTAKAMAAVLPRAVTWIKARVERFDPDNNAVNIEGNRVVRYNHLIVCPGIKLNWQGIEGLTDTLGQNGVTSNYRYDLAPYTWELTKSLQSGRALFTQPAMPIKCAGAPQKAMYLSSDHWARTGRLNDIDVAFYNAGGVLFGVADYVPALMEYVKRYNIALKFNNTLVAVDGPNKKAYFKRTGAEGATETIEDRFDMLHVVPPQTAPDFVRSSPLADAGGWVEVDPSTLRHKRYQNIYGLGDATNTPNAKTAAAARKQAPIVAENILFDKGMRPALCGYDGYGACPLTVERGKIVLAEFLYGGKLSPTFSTALIEGTKPTRAAWFLKAHVLPSVYWSAMLKGHEWLAKPKAAAL
jgi:sulfide:quinone oxidoreductase